MAALRLLQLSRSAGDTISRYPTHPLALKLPPLLLALNGKERPEGMSLPAARLTQSLDSCTLPLLEHANDDIPLAAALPALGPRALGLAAGRLFRWIGRACERAADKVLCRGRLAFGASGLLGLLDGWACHDTTDGLVDEAISFWHDLNLIGLVTCGLGGA